MIASDPALVLAARAITGAGTGIGFIAGSEYVRAAGGRRSHRGCSAGSASPAADSRSPSSRCSSGRSAGARRSSCRSPSRSSRSPHSSRASARGGGPRRLRRPRHGAPGDRRPQAVPHRGDAHGRVRSQRRGRQLGRHPARAPRLLDGAGEHARRAHARHQRRQQAPGWMDRCGTTRTGRASP